MEIFKIENLCFSYPNKEKKALSDINLKINKGEFIGIAGHTGSGKTTVAQILAGLLNPTSGSIVIHGEEFTDFKAAARALRKNVGIVFQYPEHQLFEETVYEDIAFGPKNKGLSKEEIDECVRKSAQLVHLKEEHFDKSPFGTSF